MIMKAAVKSNLLSIGITTKGRVDELRETLHIIENSELSKCSVLLIDDGGDGEFIDPQDFDLDLNIIRYNDSAGLVERRNELAELCQTKYLMSLDDDSAPESGSIDDVLNLLETDKSVVTVALNLYNEDIELKGSRLPDYESRYFVGCGHVHEVETFKQLGGYTGALFYGHEEIEYSLKLIRGGWRIIHKNSYVVKHRKSDVNRIYGYDPRMLLNMGWIKGTYLGLIPNLIEIYSLHKGGGLKYGITALKDYFRGLASRDHTNRLSLSQYWSWKRKKTPTVA